jgi:hypothetical protein
MSRDDRERLFIASSAQRIRVHIEMTGAYIAKLQLEPGLMHGDGDQGAGESGHHDATAFGLQLAQCNQCNQQTRGAGTFQLQCGYTDLDGYIGG